MHRHGPRANPCPGSQQPPLGPSAQVASQALSSQSASVGASSTDSSHSQPADGAPGRLSFTPVDCAIIKHIPKSARAICVSHLCGLLNSVVSDPENLVHWQAVLHWGQVILAAPKRGGRKHNVASSIRKRVAGFDANLSVNETPELKGSCRGKPGNPSHFLSQAVAAKLEDGNLRAAIRLLVSDEAYAAPSTEGLAKLRLKHPPATIDVSTMPVPQSDSGLSVTEIDVRKAIMSFPAGSSAGPDGLRPQHFKDLVNCQERGSDLLTTLTGFVNMVLAGHCPREVAPILFGGRLIALEKKSGGIRPIAIGLTLRRLVSKCANSFGVERLRSSFSPRQLGVGIPGGCDTAVHCARRFLQSMPAGHVMAKLDFANAFNSLHRRDMLLAVRDNLPELYPYSYSAYAHPSLLFYGPYKLMSNEGPQQGDPIGPLLFCNTVHPLLESLQSELPLGYLDDFTLGGEQSVVAKDVERVAEFGQAMGLTLNISKCELITESETVVCDPVLQSFKRVQVSEAILLGAPLTQGPALDQAWSERCSDLTRAVERLKLIASQDALILLRASFSAPRVQHLLRCSPSVGHAALGSFDELLRTALSYLTNCDLSDSDWNQASLPVRDGGLGVRRVTTLALPAFLASAASTLCLQEEILFDCHCQPDDPLVDSYVTLWSASFGAPPTGLASHRQAAWDRPGIDAIKDELQSALTDPRQKATFLAATAPHSGDWLNALPIASCGLRLDDESVRVAVALRLGLGVCVPHSCSCGEDVDAWGQHAFVCKRASGRTQRHQALNEVIARSFASAGIPVSKEPTGIYRDSVKRPDGVTLVPWQSGRAMAWDVTVATTLADSYLPASSATAAAAAEAAASRKEVKYSDLPASFSFQPIAIEILGPINESAVDFLRELGRRISSKFQDERQTVYLFQRLSVTAAI